MSRLLRYPRTLSSVKRMTRLVGPATLARIKTAVRDYPRAHPLRCRENATPAGPCDIGAYGGRGETPCAPPLVSR
eukprot:7007985-Pyramimonas_sp.AAC.1